MPIRVYCPAGHRITVPHDFAGREMACPVCGQVFIIPGAAHPGGPSGLEEAPSADVGAAGPPPTKVGGSERPVHSAGFRYVPTGDVEDSGIAQPGDWPSRGDAASARWSAVWLWAVSVFTAAPACWVLAGGSRPAWAGWLAAAGVILACATGVTLIFPDWSSRRAAGWGFAVTAAVFAYLTAAVGLSPATRILPLGLDAWRREAVHWLLSLLAIHGTTAYLCFRSAAEWKRRAELLAQTRSKKRPSRFKAPPQRGA
ncbi:MAG: hypothetical protein ACUVQK_01360 [Thermogutta sp.]